MLHYRRLYKETGNIEMEIKNIKKNQSDIKNTILEMKTISEGINSRLPEAADRNQRFGR